MDNSVTCL